MTPGARREAVANLREHHAVSERRACRVLGADRTAVDAAESRGQTAADHAASAHGKPIVQGHDVQPTPNVVSERRRHHMLMLKAEKREAAKKSNLPSRPTSSPTR